MFGMGMEELIVVLVIALLIFGPKELPKIGRAVGRSLAEFRRASEELKEGLVAELAVEEDKPSAVDHQQQRDPPKTATPSPAGQEDKPTGPHETQRG